MTLAEFRQWLTRDNELRCILVEMDYVAESDDSPVAPITRTLYFSDQVCFDDVDNRVYVDVVRSAPQYSRQLSGDQLGVYTSSISTLELDNADGQLDFLLNLAVDGSQIRFYYGSPSWPVNAVESPDVSPHFMHIFSAIVAKVSAPSYDRISVTLKDTGLLLDKSIGGTAWVSGVGPNADRNRAANFGVVHNMTPLVIDEPNLRYVHSDADSVAVATEVRDRGVAVVFTDIGGGLFELAAPPDGQVTCDVLAEPEGSGNVRISDAFDHFIGERAGLTAAGLYEGAGPTFDVGDTDDYLVGMHLPEARNTIDFLGESVDSANGFWAVKRTGEFTFGRLRLNDIAEFGLDPRTIREDDIVPKNAFRLEHALPQYYKYQATMSRNHTQQSDISDLLNIDERAVFTRKGLYVLQPDDIGGSYANRPELYHKTLAISPVIDTLLSEDFSPTDVDSLAQWMTTKRAMLLPWVEFGTVNVWLDFFELELGDPVELIQPRFGADEGVLYQVIGITINLSSAMVELRIARRTVIQPVPATWTRQESAIDDSFRHSGAPIPGGLSDVIPSIGRGGLPGPYYFGGGGIVIMRAIDDTGFDKIKFILPQGNDHNTHPTLWSLQYGMTADGSGFFIDGFNEATFLAAHSELVPISIEGIASPGTLHAGSPTTGVFTGITGLSSVTRDAGTSSQPLLWGIADPGYSFGGGDSVHSYFYSRYVTTPIAPTHVSWLTITFPGRVKSVCFKYDPWIDPWDFQVWDGVTQIDNVTLDSTMGGFAAYVF